MTRLLGSFRRRLQRARAGGDDGFMALWTMIVLVGVIIGLGGLLVDVGAALNAREVAAEVSRQAARAGADELAPASLRQASPAQLAAYTPAAIAAADRYLAQAGITDSSVTVSGRQVTVRATVHRRTQLLSAIGVPEARGSATSTATAVYGNGVQGGG
jgi:Flp pilus assembly protein TadG